MQVATLSKREAAKAWSKLQGQKKAAKRRIKLPGRKGKQKA
jgi:hypothetical protein